MFQQNPQVFLHDDSMIVAITGWSHGMAAFHEAQYSVVSSQGTMRKRKLGSNISDLINLKDKS